MTVGFVLQVLISGLAAGAIYGLVALGFTLIYRLTSVLHFAHGDVLGGALFLALFIASGMHPTTQSNAGGARSSIAFVVAVAVAAAGGALIYLAVIRPFFRRGSAIGWIGVTVALAFAVEGALAVAFPREAYVLADPFPFARMHPISIFGGASIEPQTIWILVVGVALAAAMHRLTTRTPFGRALTAIASDADAARIVGLPVDRLTAWAFALAGAVAAFAGLIGAPSVGAIATQTGLVLGLKGIAAALLGGLGDMRTTFRAALGLGVFEAAVTSLHVPGFPRLALGPAWHDVAPLILVVALLAFRPPADALERDE